MPVLVEHVAGDHRALRQRSVLPAPLNWIAALPPLMVPALKTEEPPLEEL